MNRRGFIRSALAAAFGAAAGVLASKMSVGKVCVQSVDAGPGFKTFVYQEIDWIECENCSEDSIYFLNRNMFTGKNQIHRLNL